VEYVAKSLAEKPEEVHVESFERGGGTVAIKVKLADTDVGRFIGKAGRNIEAIRTLVRSRRCAIASVCSSISRTLRFPRRTLRRGVEGDRAAR